MFPPHLATRKLTSENRERQIPRLSTSSPKGGSEDLDVMVIPGGHLISRMGRRIQNQRRWSLTTSARHRRAVRRQLNPPVMWNIQGMRGRMPSNCLWHAFQALFIGIFLFSVGSVMAYLGFEADGVFTSNSTAIQGGRSYFYEDARGPNVKFSKLSYIGPIIMGVGGFIIMAACVMALETRDSAAKVGPAAYVASEETSCLPYPVITKPRPIKQPSEMRSIGTQTESLDTTHNIHIFDKKNLLETFRKFSRTVRQSKEDDLQRYPSAPNLFEDEEEVSKSSSVPKPAAIAARRSSCLPKFRNRVPPVLFRQAMSIDCSSSSPFLPSTSRTSSNLGQTLLSTSAGVGVGGHHLGGSNFGHHNIKGRKAMGIQRNASTASSDRGSSGGGGGEFLLSPPNSQSTSRAVSSLSIDNTTSSFASGATIVRRQSAGGSGGPSSSGGGTVDLHLPNGMVTLNVIHTTGGSMLGGSSTCIARALSPHPSYHSQSDDSSFDMGGSVKSDNILIPPKSPIKPSFKSLSYRSESFGGRPSLTRQSKVMDQAEIIYIPDSDEEQQEPIPEVEHESDTDSN